MRYERDENKNEWNLEKHGIPFWLAALVFEDKSCLVYPDRVDEQTVEQRWHALGAAKAGSGSGVLLLVAHVYRSTAMAKKSSALSQPERLVRKTSEDIRNHKWTEAELESFRRMAASQAAGDDSDINFEDIPELTDEQLSKMVRLRDVRPPKVAVSVRLDARVLEWLKSKGNGHLTRINDILMNLMEAEHRSAGVSRSRRRPARPPRSATKS